VRGGRRAVTTMTCSAWVSLPIQGAIPVFARCEQFPRCVAKCQDACVATCVQCRFVVTSGPERTATARQKARARRGRTARRTAAVRRHRAESPRGQGRISPPVSSGDGRRPRARSGRSPRAGHGRLDAVPLFRKPGRPADRADQSMNSHQLERREDAADEPPSGDDGGDRWIAACRAVCAGCGPGAPARSSRSYYGRGVRIRGAGRRRRAGERGHRVLAAILGDAMAGRGTEPTRRASCPRPRLIAPGVMASDAAPPLALRGNDRGSLVLWIFFSSAHRTIRFKLSPPCKHGHRLPAT